MKRYLLIFYPFLLLGHDHPNREYACFPFKQKEPLLSFICHRFPPVHQQVRTHFLSNVGEDKKCIQLSNGSEWDISLFDRYKLDQWTKDHPIFITQNPSWGTGYRYRLINSETGTFVEAALSSNSLLSTCSKIKTLHPSKNALEFNDGTLWEISESDASLLEKWKTEDPLIAGFNTGNEHQSHEALIIHVPSNTCVQARQVQPD